jgi:hypothetical protein
MQQMATITEQDRAAQLRRGVLIGLGAAAVALIAAAGVLWAHYGTAVFFELIKAGIAYCL